MKWTCAYLNVIICLVAWSFWKTVVFATVWSCHFLRNSGTNSREAQCFLKFPTEWHNQYGFAQFPCATKRYENSNVQKKKSSKFDTPKQSTVRNAMNFMQVNTCFTSTYFWINAGTAQGAHWSENRQRWKYDITRWLQRFRMAVPVVFTDTSSELFPRQKSCSNATSCHERPQSIVFRCGREKESTRRCIEWYTIRRSELHVTPIPCSNKRRKTTENAGEPNAWSPNHKE